MENARTRSHKPVTKTLGKMRILVVEDHCDPRTVLATLLSRCGCQTVIAKNMKDARSRLATMSFDALVSDLNLPDGDGLNLVAEAKRLHGLKAIAVTGRTEAVERERGLQAGCDFYLTKPIDFHQLRCALGIPLTIPPLNLRCHASRHARRAHVSKAQGAAGTAAPTAEH